MSIDIKENLAEFLWKVHGHFGIEGFYDSEEIIYGLKSDGDLTEEEMVVYENANWNSDLIPRDIMVVIEDLRWSELPEKSYVEGDVDKEFFRELAKLFFVQ